MNMIRTGQEEAQFDNGIFFHNSEVKNETVMWLDTIPIRPVMVFESRSNREFHTTTVGAPDIVFCQRFG